MSNNEETKPRVRSHEVAGAYLFNKVKQLKQEEAGVVEAARLAHRAKIARLVAKAPADVQRAFYALSNGSEVQSSQPDGES